MPLYPVGLRAQVALLRSAPEQGVSRPPHTASRDCRTAHPLPGRSRVRLHRNAGSRGKTEKNRQTQTIGRQNDAADERKATRISASEPTRSAASRVGMAGWAGEGGGRFGERSEYEAPTLPSTPRQHGAARPPHLPAEKQHASTNARQEAAQHGTPPHTSQPRNSTPVQTPGKKQHRMAHAWHTPHTRQPRNSSPPHTSAELPTPHPPSKDMPKTNPQPPPVFLQWPP